MAVERYLREASTDPKVRAIKMTLYRTAGRSRVIESQHTLILGWSGKVYSIIGELLIANENQKQPRIVILADRDKVEMEDEIATKVEDLKKFARDFYESLKKQKYRGGVELFGIPVVRHGITIDLKSEITPEMNGYYYVEKVTKDFSDDATYRQKLELGGRAE